MIAVYLMITFISFMMMYSFLILKEHNIKTLIHLGDVVDRRKYINFRVADNFRKKFLKNYGI